MIIRNYNSKDYKEIADLFYNTVHSVCATDYTPEQLDAWAPTPVDYKKWQDRLEKKKPYVAVMNSTIVGFAELEDNGHIDCFYVHKKAQRQGIGTALLSYLEKIAVDKNITRLYAEVSITAKPFFEANDFTSVRENIVETNGQKLKNFIMEKQLS